MHPTRLDLSVPSLNDGATSDTPRAPWHQAHLVSDDDRAGGYEPPEETIEHGYAYLTRLLADSDVSDWPPKWRRGRCPGPPGTDIRVRQVFWVAQRDGLRCRYCGDDLAPSTACVNRLTPKRRGGTADLDNLGLTCLSCSAKKGCRTEEEFVAAGGAA